MTKKKAVKPQRKPKGFGKFSDLMKNLLNVPKSEVDRLEAERKSQQK